MRFRLGRIELGPVARVALVATAALIGAALVKSSRSVRPGTSSAPERSTPPPTPPARPAVARQLGSVSPGRVAWLFAAAFLFAAGAALGGAFGASADDSAQLVAATGPTSTVDTTTEVATPTGTGLGEPSASTTVETEPTAPQAVEDAPTSESDAPSEPSTSTAETPPSPSPSAAVEDETEAGPVVHSQSSTSHRAPETTEGAGAVIWLHRVLPDPTPPARRLDAAFAARVAATAREYGVRWSLILAVLRAHGREGRVPASAAELSRVARRLAAHTLSVDAEILALKRYNRAVTLNGLVTGIEAAKPRLERRVLRDGRLDIYPAGRADVAAGRVDARVLVVMRYLAITFGQVEITSLVSGHRLFARRGVVSAHVDGLAVDVATLHGIPVTGHQEPGGITERAVEALLRLPAELQPQQVISLLGLGGASFAQADHYDHIHVGF